MIIGITGNIHKPRARTIIERFIAILKDRDLHFCYSEDLTEYLELSPEDPVCPLEELSKQVHVVVSFGGDGTMLATAQSLVATGVPVLGVNIGNLGFLTEVMVEEMETAVDMLIQGQYDVIDRMMFQVVIKRKMQVYSYYALNDVVIDKGIRSRLITVAVDVNDRFLNLYRSDGIIISTPTGSTAYSLSAGGPLMVPDMEAIIVTPICPHSLTVRPIVLSRNSRLKIYGFERQDALQISIDGQQKTKVSGSDWVTICPSERGVRWISTHNRDFFKVLRTKLNWGADKTTESLMNGKI
jgi:NAD+ kinase